MLRDRPQRVLMRKTAVVAALMRWIDLRDRDEGTEDWN